MIRVIIEREIAEGLEKFYEQAISKLLHVMTSAPGYVSGESMIEIHRPNHYVVITRWADEAAWNRWFQSTERQNLLAAIRPFLLNDEKLTLLQHLAFHEDASAA